VSLDLFVLKLFVHGIDPIRFTF